MLCRKASYQNTLQKDATNRRSSARGYRVSSEATCPSIFTSLSRLSLLFFLVSWNGIRNLADGIDWPVIAVK